MRLHLVVTPWRRLCAVVVLSLSGQDAAQATADGPDFFQVRRSPSVNAPLYSQPDSTSARVGVLPAGATCLRNLGCQGGLTLHEFSAQSATEQAATQQARPRWCQVAYAVKTAWVPGALLTEGSCRPERKREGRLRGYQTETIKVMAGAGQWLRVDLKAGNPQTYFNINPPGSPLSVFVGSSSGNSAALWIPVDGEYSVQVYLMRAAARRNESSRYQVSIHLENDPLPPLPAKQDALIPGTPFHASATVACNITGMDPAPACTAFVIRRGLDGTATVEVSWSAEGATRTRRILFVGGYAMGADSQWGLESVRDGELTRVRIGDDENFEIPDPLLSGG